MLLPDEKTMWAQKLPLILNGHHISLELRNNANNNVDGLDCDHQGSCIKYYIQYTTKPKSHAVLRKMAIKLMWYGRLLLLYSIWSNINFVFSFLRFLHMIQIIITIVWKPKTCNDFYHIRLVETILLSLCRLENAKDNLKVSFHSPHQTLWL